MKYILLILFYSFSLPLFSVQKAIVTGGAGFIGSHMVERLIEDGYEVHVIDNLSTGYEKNIHPSAIFHKIDLSEIDAVELSHIFKGSDVVFHMAALARVQPSIEDPIFYNKHNVDATLRVLEAARLSKTKRVVYSASSAAYGEVNELPTSTKCSLNPLSPYGLQKLMGEFYCKLYSEIYNLSTVSLRYFNVYGERMSESGAYCTVLGIWSAQVKQNLPITITNDGDQKRDYVYVRDVVQANMNAALSKRDFCGETYNIGTGKSYSINELALLFNKETKYIGNRIEPRETLADISKTSEELEWYPEGDIIHWTQLFVNELNKYILTI
jgi:UDP-glucose 4-epimerase